MPGVCNLSRPGARWRRAQVGVPQCDHPALPLMLLLQLQPPVPHVPDTSSESHYRRPAQMEHRVFHLHTVLYNM